MRARTIARTETHAAATAGTDFAAKTVQDINPGITMMREWVAIEDSRTRQDHKDADGQVVGMDDPFTVGDSDLMRPGDPDGDPSEVINCRCCVAYQTQ